LPELLLGFGIFLLFLGGVFSFFSRGYQAFHFLTTRQSVQGQALRLKTVLEADFHLTHYRSIGVERRTVTVAGQPAERDDACCLILDDWQSPSNYRGATGIPLWNRYAVYQTGEAARGRLERLVLAPGTPAPLRVHPLANLSSPAGSVSGRQLLTTSLKSFSCELDAYRQEVVISFELEETAGKRGLDQNTTDESFKAVFHWTPNNTVPRF
jgi:hypothetical protein